MTPLIIGKVERDAVKRVVDYAAQPAHWYRPGPGVTLPGHKQAHVVDLWAYHCVFSYSVIQDKLLRHLTLSVPTTGLPHPIAVLIIAQLFGFTGWKRPSTTPPEDWVIGVHHSDRCVVVAQDVPELVAAQGLTHADI